MPDTNEPEVMFAACSRCERVDKLYDGVCVHCLGARISTWFSNTYRLPLAARFESSTFGSVGNLVIQIEQGRIVFFIDDLDVIDRMKDALDNLREHIEAHRVELSAEEAGQ